MNLSQLRRIFFAIVFVSIIVAASSGSSSRADESFILVEGAIFDIDVSGVATGTAYLPGGSIDSPHLAFTVGNLSNVYESAHATRPCISRPNYYCPPNRGFRSQIPQAYCDGTQRTLSVYAYANLGVGFNSPLGQKTFRCYRADTPDKIPPKTPVIFIPGIGGSVLSERNGSGETVIFPDKIFSNDGINNPTGGLNRLDLSLGLNIVATDALREIEIPLPLGTTLAFNIYNEFIETVKDDGGYGEYFVNGIPERQTSEGCRSEEQRISQPTLFVFAYDWRQSNSFNSTKLKDYIQCVQKFYPGTNVNIVAHSMGGLLARRYLLDYSLNHRVNKLVTIGSPWLGAPKAFDVLMKGDFLPIPRVIYDHTEEIRRIGLLAKGTHELLPSKWYWGLGGRPLRELVDANGDGIFPQVYDNHSMASSWLDSAKPFDSSQPYRNSSDLHDFPSQSSQFGQDDWRQDSAGVEYYHIWGQLAFEPLLNMGTGTINEVIIAAEIDKRAVDIRRKYKYLRGFGKGDGTVPSLSASRDNGSQSIYYFDQTIDIPYISQDFQEDSIYDHNGLLSNPEVLEEVLFHLEEEERSFGMKARVRLGETREGSTVKFDRPEKFESKEAMREFYANRKQYYESEEFQRKVKSNLITLDFHFLEITGTKRLQITDSSGNTNTALSSHADLAITNVSYEYGSAPDSKIVYPHEVRMPANEVFDIKFLTATEGIQIEIYRGPGKNLASQSIRYKDLLLPEGVMAWIRFTPQGVENLRYDQDGDGNFESTIIPTYSLTGQAAQDVYAPSIGLQVDAQEGFATISFLATDQETGVNKIFYQVDSEIPQLYSSPFIIDLLSSRFIFAFAEDNAGNRSSVFKHLDSTPPNTTIVFPGTQASVGWSKEAVAIEINAIDDLGGTGLREIVYGVSGATEIPETRVTVLRGEFEFPRPSTLHDTASVNVEVTGEGISTLSYFSVDRHGNSETLKSSDVRIDYSPPRSDAEISIFENVATVSLSATDVKLVYNPNTETYEPDPNFPVSGVRSIMYSIDGAESRRYRSPIIFVGTGSGGTHTLSYYSIDNAGNVENEHTETFTVTASITPKSVHPVLECVERISSVYSRARFGYVNLNPESVNIWVGLENRLNPGDANQGQPVVFQSGQVENAFETVFTGPMLTWELTGPNGVKQTASATRKTIFCE